jgi:hypothetical protein
MALGVNIPVLRSFDEGKMRAFYCGFLGFTVLFEHRLDNDSPLYVGLARDGCSLHLSEHHGDCTPGAHVRISTTALDALAQELSAKNYRYARPGIEMMPWGLRELSVTDPFGNRLTFFEPSPAAPSTMR